MTIHVCDACGAQIEAVPPTWATITVVMQAPNPEPAAPSSTSWVLYACDLHDPTGIATVFSDAMKSLPTAKE